MDKTFWSRGEVRLNDSGGVDEVVTGQLSGVHLEQLDDGLWWMSLDGKGGRRMVINFSRRGRTIHVSVEDDGFYSSGIAIGFDDKGKSRKKVEATPI